MILKTPDICPICGAGEFASAPVLTPSLIAAWKLDADDVLRIDHQQGLHCTMCQANLRSMTLAVALLRTFRSALAFEDFCRDHPEFSRLRILEANAAGSLSPFLQRCRGHTLRCWPEIDLQHMADPDNSWDVVLHSDTLEHVPDFRAALRECRRVLRPGGWLAFTIPILPTRLSQPADADTPSSHGLTADEQSREDYRVHTEFGADAWAHLMDAGFLDVAVHSLTGSECVALVARKPAPAAAEFTGERLMSFLPAGRRISTEHLHRYAIAAELCRGLRVLDIACGEGYGSAILSRRAATVAGVDICAETVAAARLRYERVNLTFTVGSAMGIPLPDNSVDFAVSFETLEHLDTHERFLVELRRVLVPGGRLLISTPDRREYSEKSGLQNPNHVRELDAAEFRDLLGRHFRCVSLAGQRYVVGSCLTGDAPLASGQGFFTADYESMPFSAGPGPSTYWIALCSDEPLPQIPLGLCLPPQGTLDGWLEAMELLPSAEPLLELAKNNGLLNSQSILAGKLAETREALAKQKLRAEKWKARTEQAKNALQKLRQSQRLPQPGFWKKLTQKWRRK